MFPDKQTYLACAIIITPFCVIRCTRCPLPSPPHFVAFVAAKTHDNDFVTPIYPCKYSVQNLYSLFPVYLPSWSNLWWASRFSISNFSCNANLQPTASHDLINQFYEWDVTIGRVPTDPSFLIYLIIMQGCISFIDVVLTSD